VDTPTFVDGIGRRLLTVDPTGEEVETLRLCKELSEGPGTEAALIERAGRLAGFSHASFGQVRRVERIRGPLGGLAVVSTAVPGTRLSDLLALGERNGVAADFGASLYILEKAAAALAALHRHSGDLSHGALGPERIVVRPDGHPVIVEHVLAPAISQLQMGRSLLWVQFRVPAPAVAGTARLDQMTDIMQLGILALALILGRPIRREEFPQKLQDLLTEASAPGPVSPRPAVSRSLHGWILRTLQFESRSAFRTMADVAASLSELAAEQPLHKTSPASVIGYVTACKAAGDGADGLPSVRAGIAPVAETTAKSTGSTESLHVSSGAQEQSTTRRVFRSAGPDAWRERAQATETHPPERRAQAALPVRTASRVPEETPSRAAFVIRAVSGAARASIRRVSRLDWSSVHRSLQVALVSLGLAALFGATYLAARGYWGLPSFMGGRGTLVVESLPSGADLYVDGLPSGRTPATLQLPAGEHTLALRTGKGTTLVPVVVVSGAHRVEHVEIRQRRQIPFRPPAPSAAPPTGAASAGNGK
jgi:hypothetical protein